MAPKIPWVRIFDYLTEIGTESDIYTFGYKAIQELNSLIPYDIAGLFIHKTSPFQLTDLRLFNIDQHFQNDYLNYYNNLDPFRTRMLTAVLPDKTDWSGFQNTEFVTDFIKPQGIHYSMAIPIPVRGQEIKVHFGFQRTGRVDFNKEELTIARTVQPLLANYCSLLTRQREFNFNLENKLLTKRESEVAALLCQRCTAAEIATKLLISRRTVEYHMMNIYEKLKVRNRRQLFLKLNRGESK